MGKILVLSFSDEEEETYQRMLQIISNSKNFEWCNMLLLITLLVWRRMEGKKPIKLSGKTVGTVVLAIFGALLLGVGMCFSMVFGKMVLGVVIGLVGIVALLMLIPLTKGLK